MDNNEFERALQQIREGKMPRIGEHTPCAVVARQHLHELLRYVQALEIGYNTATMRLQIHERCRKAKNT